MSLAEARIKAGGFPREVVRDLALTEFLEEWHAGHDMRALKVNSLR